MSTEIKVRNGYVLCSSDNCSAQLPLAMAEQWGGKCPRCNGTSNYGSSKKSSASSYVPKGFVFCESKGCNVKIAKKLIEEDPSFAVCPLCREKGLSAKPVNPPAAKPLAKSMPKMKVGGMELAIFLMAMEPTFTKWESQAFFVPALNKKVSLIAVHEPGSEYQWNGCIKERGEELGFHSYRNDSGSLYQVFDCLVLQLKNMLSVEGTYEHICDELLEGEEPEEQEEK